MGRKKGSKNKPKEDNGTRPVTGLSIVASINSSLSKFARAKEPFDKKPPTINLEDMEGEFEVDPDKKVEFRVPPKDAYDSEKLPDTTIDEHPIYETVKPVLLNGPVFDQGKIQKRINDLTNHEVIETIDGVQELPPLKGVQPSGLAIDTEKFNVPPFPSNWNEMGKVQKLEWLTANPRK
jgi:hypothetical protein